MYLLFLIFLIDIKKIRTPSPAKRSKYNRQPRNIEVKRVNSPRKKPKISTIFADQSKRNEDNKNGATQESDKKPKVADAMKSIVKSKIVEFTWGLLDLPALKRKYLSKNKREK